MPKFGGFSKAHALSDIQQLDTRNKGADDDCDVAMADEVKDRRRERFSTRVRVQVQV
jgi:hypothetical protein